MPLPAHYLKNGGPGSPKGIAKVSTLAAREIMEEAGFNPILEAISWIKSPEKSEETKNFCLNLLMKRYSPEIKQVEHSGSIDGVGNKTIQILYTEDKAKET